MKYFLLSSVLSFYISLTKTILTSRQLSASTLQYNVTIIEGRGELITSRNFPTHFKNYLWIYTRVFLEMIKWGHDAGYLEGKVIFWVDTGDIYFS
jgi:hypothetical protein